MKHSAEEITKRLKSKGLRVTPQRFAIYSNLLSRTDHPTVEQLLEDLNQDFPIASLATIYSSLQVLKEVDLVQALLGLGYKKSEAEREAKRVCEEHGDAEFSERLRLALGRLSRF